MLTNFGKKLRKLRIDRDELLKDMASKLGVTAAYLSAVENGNREVPDAWLNILRRLYELDDREFKELQESVYDEKNVLRLDLEDISEKEKELTLSFARRFKSLSDDQIIEILKVLDD